MILPVLPLRDLVMFPGMIAPLLVGREKSIKAIEARDKMEGNILLLAQKDSNQENLKPNDLYKVGVVSKVLQVLKLQSTNMKILVEGATKVKIIRFITDQDYLQAEVKIIKETNQLDKEEVKQLVRSLKDLFEEYVKLHRRISNEILHTILEIKEPEALIDAISAHLILRVEKKQKLLEINKIQQKFEELIILLKSEIEFINTDNKIKNRVKSQIEKSQRDFYLNEQLKAIHKELGEDDIKDELSELGKKIKKLKLSKEARQKAEGELKKLQTMSPSSAEANVIRSYLDWILALPWDKNSVINKDLKAAQEKLDEDHFGLEKIKERIIEYLAVNLKISGSAAGPIICLVGPPGVGKTSLARSIAKATGREFIKVAVGGLKDEAEIKGHRRTYVAAMPGKIITAMKKAGTCNPIILLDEIDKMGMEHRSDPSAALLEVLDPEQNKNFNDHYMEIDYDLSQVMFITTANSTAIPKPLLDRLEVIRLSGYTEEEKNSIAINYLIPKQTKAHGLKAEEISIEDEVVKDIIHFYTREAGVRSLERSISTIMRKAVKQIMVDKVKKVKVTSSNLKSFLGVRKFLYGLIRNDHRIGVTNGLSYSEVGGDLLEIEAVVMPGKGEIKITGKLGDVMKESVLAAISYIRSRSLDWDLEVNFFKEHDIHLHVPEGAIPKDGPSAGIAICTSILSAITKIPVKNNIAMTGEITLGGRVLGIGGLKEKLLAALRGGVKQVLIPSENIKDLDDIPAKVIEGLEIISVESADEVVSIALVEKPHKNQELARVVPPTSLVKKEARKTKAQLN